MRVAIDFCLRVRSLITIELERAWRSRTTWTLAGAMLLVAALVAFGATSGAVGGEAATPGQEARAAFGGVAALRVFVMLIGVLCVTSEYHHGDIVWRYLVEPSRAVMVTAKAVTCALIGALLGVLALQIGAVVTVIRVGSGLDTLGLTTVDAVHTVVGTVFGAALAGVVGVGIGAAVRNQTAAVVGTLVGVLVVEPVFTALAPTIAAFLPSASAAAAAAAGGAATLGWVAGLVLSAAYAMVAAVVGGLVCARSDV